MTSSAVLEGTLYSWEVEQFSRFSDCQAPKGFKPSRLSLIYIAKKNKNKKKNARFQIEKGDFLPSFPFQDNEM